MTGRRSAEGPRRIVRALATASRVSRAVSGRRANLVLFAVTAVEFIFLVRPPNALAIEDWIYLSQHLLVLGISLARREAVAQDQSRAAAFAVVVSYAYPYAEVLYLNSTVGHVAWSAGGATLVTLSALLSLAALLSIGRSFGVRPALRAIATRGPYRLVRHPMYLAYCIGDVGYLLEAWNIGLMLIVASGWAALVWRICAEERLLSLHPGWTGYVGRTPRRLVPGLW